MKTPIILLFILFIGLSCTQKIQVDQKLGESVFKTNCVICHGRDGKLEINDAKDLGLSILSVDERVVIIREGKNLMVPFKNLLNDEQIKAVASYTLKFSYDQ